MRNAKKLFHSLIASSIILLWGIFALLFAIPTKAAVNYTYSEIETVTDYDYSLLGIPDLQNLTKWKPGYLSNMFMQLTTRAKQNKLAFAMFVGDLCQDPNETQFQTGREAFAQFDDAGIPYAVVPGNHDYDTYTGDVPTNRNSTKFNKYFKYDTYKDLPTFGGAKVEGDMTNTYHLFEAKGVKYMVVALEASPLDPTLEWADGLIKANSDRRTIILTHDYMYPSKDRSPHGEKLWLMAKKHENIFMILCGHRNNLDPVFSMGIGDNGNKIMQILICMQNVFDEAGDNVPLALYMKFNEKQKTINFYLFNPINGLLMNNNQFTHVFADENNPTVGAIEADPVDPVDPNPDPEPNPDEPGCKSKSAAIIPLFGVLAVGMVPIFIKRKSEF